MSHQQGTPYLLFYSKCFTNARTLFTRAGLDTDYPYGVKASHSASHGTTALGPTACPSTPPRDRFYCEGPSPSRSTLTRESVTVISDR